jgi:hypothetical protein
LFTQSTFDRSPFRYLLTRRRLLDFRICWSPFDLFQPASREHAPAEGGRSRGKDGGSSTYAGYHGFGGKGAEDWEAATRLRLHGFQLPTSTRARTKQRSKATTYAPVKGPECRRCRETGGDAVIMSPIWVFKYGSLILNPGIADDARVVGFIGDYQICLPLYVSVRDLVV